MRPLALVIAAALTLSVASSASAQPKQQSADHYRYYFEDDHMVGDTIGGTSPVIRGMKRGLRVQLLRPRASFVAEMLKSVEVM